MPVCVFICLCVCVGDVADAAAGECWGLCHSDRCFAQCSRVCHCGIQTHRCRDCVCMCACLSACLCHWCTARWQYLNTVLTCFWVVWLLWSCITLRWLWWWRKQWYWWWGDDGNDYTTMMMDDYDNDYDEIDDTSTIMMTLTIWWCW